MRLLSRDEVLELSNGQVTSDLLFLRNQEPDPNGLFSKVIFGESLKDKQEKWGHIELNCRIFHPHILRLFKDTYRKEYKIAKELKPFIFDEDKQEIIQIDEKDLEKYDPGSILYGFYGIIVLLHKLKRKQNKTSETFWTILEKFPQDSIFITVLPVIPLFYRDYKNEFQYDQINDVYLSIIKSSNRISSMTPSNSKSYALAINYMQTFVYNLYEFMQEKIAKKTGFIRQNLLGKRVDFSGRAVATVDPEIPPDTVGIPFRIAVNLFEPWIVRELTNRYHYQIPDVIENLQKISKGLNVDSDFLDKTKQITEEISRERYVLIKRDPNLHRGSIKAFKVKIVYDNTIHTSPITNESFNLDYDGDSLFGVINLLVGGKNGNHVIELRTNINQIHQLEVSDEDFSRRIEPN